jgi:hypothetical protein
MPPLTGASTNEKSLHPSAGTSRLVFGATSNTVTGAGAMSTVLLTFVVGMAAVGSLLIAEKRTRQAAEELKQIAAATRAYIEDLEQSRAFTPIAVPRLHLEQGEFAVRYGRATLAESRSVRVGGGLGTRVRIGGFPIYLGGFKSVPER